MLALGADHAGYPLKEALKRALERLGVAYRDLGCHSTDSVDYPDFAAAVAQGVAAGEYDKGVLVCGTGIGMAMTANRVRGVRAAVVTDAFTARMARAHNDANVLCLGARVTGEGVAIDALEIFLSQPFEGGRHERRIRKIDDLGR